MAQPVEIPLPWHARPIDEVAAVLGTDPERGLDPAAVPGLQRAHGKNEIADKVGRRRMELFVDQFRSMLVGLLVIAAAISGIALGEWLEAAVIAAIVVLNAGLGYWQEARAEDALQALKRLTAPAATVVRGGEQLQVDAVDLVPGDLLVLSAGDQVAADARVAAMAHLEADESTLTGESLPVPKDAFAVGEDARLGDRRSMVHAGTVVSAGRGTAIVVATGRSTEVGKLAGFLEEADDPTPLQVALDRIGRRIAALATLVAAGIFVMGILRDQPAESMFLTAVALAVAAIPEGLPAVVTVTLSRGVSHMARENALVRRLSAVEALGASSVICTDKTGTLTRNRLRVQEVRFPEATVDAARLPTADRRGARMRDVAVLCSDARIVDGSLAGDPTEVALITSIDPALRDLPTRRASFPRIDEIAFDSRRKRMTTLHGGDEGFLLCAKGAPEVLIERCDRIQTADGEAPLDESLRTDLLEATEEMGSRGLRTLALAYRTFETRPGSIVHAESDLVLVAIAAMSDEVRPEARDAVSATRDAGIRVVMITGDHAVTARAVGRKVGILGPGQDVMGGGELAVTSTDDLVERVERIGAFARVDPADKVKIVRAWQSKGGIVAMTGDGVNDAPALRAADIGVAMGSGTDVAKDAADMVLADDNYATILSAVRAGRGIFANLKKVVYFLLSANISEVLVMLFGFLLITDLGPPLLATQLLWVNLVTDGVPAIALGVDRTDPGLMARPPEAQRDILGGPHQLRLFWQGVVLAVATLAALSYGHYLAGEEPEAVRTITFSALVVAQMIHVYNARSQGRSLGASIRESSRSLHATVAVSILLHLTVVYTPAGHAMFDTVAIGVDDWLVIVAASVLSAVVIGAIKRWVGRAHPDWSTARD